MKAPRRLLRCAGLAAIAVGTGSCTVTSNEPPPVTGPSELGISITLVAAPEVVARDGVSEASVSVLARDAYARPVPGLALRADLLVDGVLQEFGRLSPRDVATGTDGRSVLTYTAPPAVLGVTTATVVSVAVTPLSGDARGQVGRTVDIRVVPVLTTSSP